MPSCDNNFSLLNKDLDPHQHHHSDHLNHHLSTSTHHHQFPHQGYLPWSSISIHTSSASQPIASIIPGMGGGSSPYKVVVSEAQDPVVIVEYTARNGAFYSQNVNPFFYDDNDPNLFKGHSLDLNNKVRIDGSPNEKMKDMDDTSDESASNSYRKPKPAAFAASGVEGMLLIGGSSGEYRNDREEWRDVASNCLLEAYTYKYTQLNRGNLRGID